MLPLVHACKRHHFIFSIVLYCNSGFSSLGFFKLQSDFNTLLSIYYISYKNKQNNKS